MPHASSSAAVPEPGSVLPAGWVAVLSVRFYPPAFGTSASLRRARRYRARLLKVGDERYNANVDSLKA